MNRCQFSEAATRAGLGRQGQVEPWVQSTLTHLACKIVDFVDILLRLAPYDPNKSVKIYRPKRFLFKTGLTVPSPPFAHNHLSTVASLPNPSRALSLLLTPLASCPRAPCRACPRSFSCPSCHSCPSPCPSPPSCHSCPSHCPSASAQSGDATLPGAWLNRANEAKNVAISHTCALSQAITERCQPQRLLKKDSTSVRYPLRKVPLYLAKPDISAS